MIALHYCSHFTIFKRIHFILEHYYHSHSYPYHALHCSYDSTCFYSHLTRFYSQLMFTSHSIIILLDPLDFYSKTFPNLMSYLENILYRVILPFDILHFKLSSNFIYWYYVIAWYLLDSWISSNYYSHFAVANYTMAIELLVSNAFHPSDHD